MDVVGTALGALGLVSSAGAVWYARRADRSAVASAQAARLTADLDLDRRHVEMRPRFRVSVERPSPNAESRRLRITLVGPPELKRLDKLIVSIRDDNPWRAQSAMRRAAGPTAQQIAEHVWGPYRFVPGTGPNVVPGTVDAGADETGRTTPTSGMPVGETLRFRLESTRSPPWNSQSPSDWMRERGPILRLRLECHRDGWDPWALPCEVDASGETVEV